MIGKNLTRVDSLEKAMGTAKFVEDYYTSDALFVKQYLSQYSHAYIENIEYSGIKKIKGVIGFLTHKDIPGENQVGYAIPDQPLLAEGKVRYHSEPIGLIVAENPESALEAIDYVNVTYKPLKVLLDPLEALNEKNVFVHEKNGSNIAFKTKVRKGNIEKGFEEADVIVENEYRTHHQDHLYLETEGALAIPGHEGRLTIITAAQHPHLAQGIVSRVLGIPASKIKIIVPYLGGGFGGKDDEGPLVAAKAALVAYKYKKPAFLLYTRDESLKVHPKRESTIIRYKSGASKDGKLTAIKVQIIHDTGAYANRGPFILWRATVHASGPYSVPNAHVDGLLVYTNKFPQGSFRGFGNPSVQFAAESQMDQLAEKLGMDPIEFRLKNILRPGQTTITNQKIEDSIGIGEALRKVAEKSGWFTKRREYKAKNGKRFRKGIGVGVAWHGNSTSRGVPDWSNAYIKIEKDGSVSLYTGIVEIGQGSPSSSHYQIVAEVLGAPLDKINIIFGTTEAPDGGATHASRGTSIGAIGVLVAAARLRERLNKVASEILGSKPENIVITNGKVYDKENKEKSIGWNELIKEAYSRGVEMSATGYFFLPKGRFDDEKGQGYAYPTYSYIALIIEVTVDTWTGKVRVDRVWPALSTGKIINPQQVEGQIEGAAVQGISYTLFEEFLFSQDGKVINADMTDYVISTTIEVPKIEKPIYVEDLFSYGPFGAKGVGEMALIPVPAALSNAVSHALGFRIKTLPLTSEKLYFQIKNTG